MTIRTSAWNYTTLAEAAATNAEHADSDAERRVWLAVAERDRESAALLTAVAQPVLMFHNDGRTGNA